MEPSDLNYRFPAGWHGYPFLVRVDGELAGFALVRQTNQDCLAQFDIGDFFILRKFRRSGVGRIVAHTIFNRFKGDWEVAQMVGNAPAQAFWWKVISEYTGNSFIEATGKDELHGVELVIQRFSNL